MHSSWKIILCIFEETVISENCNQYGNGKNQRNSKQARALLEMLKTFSFVEIVKQPRYNSATEKALKEAREGKATEVSLEDFRKELYS